MVDITAIILTYNEELNIAKCISSIKDFCTRIVVIDSFSTDETMKIAKNMGCDVYQNKWEGYSKQFKFGLTNSNISTEWVLRIDADERITDDAKKEIIEKIENNSECSGIIVPFEVSFLGKKLRHGGIFPFRKLILFKKDYGTIEEKNMDEHIVLSEGKTLTIKNVCEHYDNKSLKVWLHKHIDYAFREADDAELLLKQTAKFKDRKRLMYYKLPSFIRSKLYFIYRYYFKLGFLDGKAGRYFALLQAYFYRVAIDAALYERKQNKQ